MYEQEGWVDYLCERIPLGRPGAPGDLAGPLLLLASDASHWRGVACRSAQSWVTQVIGREVFLEQQGGYRTASAATSHPIEQFIDQTATDIALSADEEIALIARSWLTDSNP